MSRNAFSYFAQGHKKAKAYCKRGFGNRLLATFYQIANLLATFSVFFAPMFATSNFGFNYMLKEADDAIVEKSFDGAENGKNYFTSLIATFVCASIVGVIALFVWGFYSVISNVLTISVPNPAEASMFSTIFLVVFSIIGGIGGIVALLTLQAALYVVNKNKVLGAGDVLYNAFRFVRAHGMKLFVIDLIHIVTLALMVAPYIVGGIVLNNLANSSYQFFPTLFRVLAASIYGLGLVIALFFLGQVLTAFHYSVFAYFADEVEATKFVVVYPKPDAVVGGEKKGRFIEIVSLDDEETHPLEPVSVEEEDPE